MPYFRADMSRSLFHQSAIGRCFSKKENQPNTLPEKDEVSFKDLLPILKEFNIWQFTAFHTILCFRIKSIQGEKHVKTLRKSSTVGTPNKGQLIFREHESKKGNLRI